MHTVAEKLSRIRRSRLLLGAGALLAVGILMAPSGGGAVIPATTTYFATIAQGGTETRAIAVSGCSGGTGTITGVSFRVRTGSGGAQASGTTGAGGPRIDVSSSTQGGVVGSTTALGNAFVGFSDTTGYPCTGFDTYTFQTISNGGTPTGTAAVIRVCYYAQGGTPCTPSP